MEKQLQKLNINDVFLSVTAISDKMAYPNVITKIQHNISKQQEAAFCKYPSKQLFLNISQYSQEKNLLCQKLFLIKQTPKQMFFCGYCKIFMNNLFNRTPLVAASVQHNQLNYFSFTALLLQKIVQFEKSWQSIN